MKLSLKIITKDQLIKAWPYFALSLAIVIFDQWSKFVVVNNFNIGESQGVIDGFLKFTYVHNKGAAFSFGNTFNDTVRMVIFKILPVIVSLFLVKYILSEKEHKLMRFAYALILGGGAGNVIDRIRLDYVVDFISVYHTGINLGFTKLAPWYFAIFNIADSAVSIAAALIILDFLLNREKENKS
ncbi:MAG: signal peptidase II [Halobacteriovoraceae bacterium]|jgi:signal peptidase II|nr:signal peptidase II [Halobacteriovoraceae bacterium]